ncbi:MAG: ABC transporter ATP-binding protein [Planctomycetes bacterium]|nr:ABC transporter ATP-binding protein [Planctomycetota bacterium]
MSDAAQSLLCCNGLSVVADGRHLLNDVNLTLQAGQFVALVGKNGAGKTTLLRAALGLAKPAAGRALLSGYDANTLPGRQRAGLVGWLPQNAPVPEPVAALDLVVAGRFRFNESFAASRVAAQDALAQAGAQEFENAAMTRLSGGEQQRVALAALIAQESPLLLLDEPANHLDPAQQIALYRLIGDLWRQGRAILCVTHDLNLLRFARLPNAAQAPLRVVGLQSGRVSFEVDFDAPELAPSLDRLFGVRLREVSVEGGRLLVPEDTR